MVILLRECYADLSAILLLDLNMESYYSHITAILERNQKLDYMTIYRIFAVFKSLQGSEYEGENLRFKDLVKDEDCIDDIVKELKNQLSDSFFDCKDNIFSEKCINLDQYTASMYYMLSLVIDYLKNCVIEQKN